MALFFGVLFSFGVWFAFEARLLSEKQKDESISYYVLEGIPGVAKRQFETLKPVFREFWDKTVDTFEKVGAKGTEMQNRNTPPTSIE